MRLDTSDSDIVKLLQIGLNEAEAIDLLVDGKYGPQTKGALRTYLHPVKTSQRATSKRGRPIVKDAEELTLPE